MILDSASQARLRLLYPDFAVRIRRVIATMWEQHKIELRITEGLRTFEYQAELYAKGRTLPGNIVTWAKPGQSLHHYGIAVDFARRGSQPYELPWEYLGRYIRGSGLTWGGDWHYPKTDKPHAELRYGGYTTAQLHALYNRSGLESVWAAFDILRGVPVGSEWRGPQKDVRLVSVGKIQGGLYDKDSDDSDFTLFV